MVESYDPKFKVAENTLEENKKQIIEGILWYLSMNME